MHFNVFQLIVLPILAILIIKRISAVARGRIPRRVAFFWLCIWLGSALTVAFPNVTSDVARSLGIGRGTDLVIYFAVLFMFLGFYMTYVRVRRLDANITLLVRQLAIQNARQSATIEPPSIVSQGHGGGTRE